MTLAFAVAAAVLFGAGAYLLLDRDLLRVVGGIALISQAAAVTLIGVSLSRGRAPIDPDPSRPVSDPVPQALVLTALVIGLATLALLLALVHRVVVVVRTARREELASPEAEHSETGESVQQRDREVAA
jgi:multicomponent Na+:H+ antiporter subunit C